MKNFAIKLQNFQDKGSSMSHYRELEIISNHSLIVLTDSQDSLDTNSQ